MPPSPWRTVAVPADNRDLLAIMSYLPVRTFGAEFRVLRFAARIRKQLHQCPGLVGYSMKVKILTKEFWTLSAWTDERSLQRFVHAGVHAISMHELKPFMARTKFTRWTIRAGEVPISWKDALQRGKAS